MSKYEVFKDKDGDWRFHLRADNGEIVVQSEAYTRREDAERGVEAAREASAEADHDHQGEQADSEEETDQPDQHDQEDKGAAA